MLANHDLDANEGPSEPSRFPTSTRTSSETDCEDQSDDQLERGKREREDQIQCPRKRRSRFRASRSLDREQEEGCNIGPSMHRKGESLPEVSSPILGIFQSSLQQGESSKETKKREQAGAELPEYDSLQAEINNSLRTEKHYDTIIKLRCQNRKNINLKQHTRGLRARNKRLARENKQLAQKNEQLARETKRLNIEFGKAFEASLSDRANVIKSQIMIDAKDLQIEYFRSIALEHCGKPLQHGDSTEESDTTIQGMENLRLEVSEVKKQLQEKNTTWNKRMQVFEENQQETETRILASVNWMIDAKIQELDNYNHHDAEPIGSGDGYLPVLPGLDFSAPTPFPDLYQEATPLQAISSDTVAFEPLISPGSNEPMSSRNHYSIHPPCSPTSSLRSQDAGGVFLSVLPWSEYQDESWTGFSS
ncbi:uncharacterized protein BBA_04932 [Beauveria bassiana ARSEF 2860]|uniref:Uncharacterized protein n=1 Tax=Beauveria bassiana (strain ARSEF 2860) TaxID=655819 RepID=J5JTQ6_BEAB2|nr:uncharacterized protein BBA_04932 [Beauveria bassiana ARSEF 2860]EJP65961.1 hypothetical protein BBA_04932 [Beauveria bassiana ARSEF 2860]